MRPSRLRLLEPVTFLWIALIVALLVLVAAPLGKMVVISFEAQETGEFTLANYLTAYGRQRYLDALRNSLLLGLYSAAISTVLAVPMAWAVSRTDMPGKTFTWVMVLAAFIMPPYLGAIGWILLAGPNAGWINQVWRWATGADLENGIGWDLAASPLTHHRTYGSVSGGSDWLRLGTPLGGEVEESQLIEVGLVETQVDRLGFRQSPRAFA